LLGKLLAPDVEDQPRHRDARRDDRLLDFLDQEMRQ
jgi:hypothetical protein